MRNGRRSEDGSEQNDEISGAQLRIHDPGSELPPDLNAKAQIPQPKEDQM